MSTLIKELSLRLSLHFATAAQFAADDPAHTDDLARRLVAAGITDLGELTINQLNQAIDAQIAAQTAVFAQRAIARAIDGAPSTH